MIRKYWDKYKDVILYLIFGGFTTVVNIVVYWFCVHILGTGVMFGTVAAWALAVFFAYVTNRSMVFHSSATGKSEILKEIGSFFACRLGTGVVDWVIMFVFVTVLHFNDMIIKILANIIVIILNFVLSKFVIFKMETIMSKKILQLISADFEDLEVWYPVYRCREEGWQVDFAAEKPGLYHGKYGVPCEVELSFKDLDPDDYDGLLVPGGWAPDKLRRFPEVLNIVRKMNADGKAIGEICHAGWVLISADILRGKKVTSTPGIKDDMSNAGGIWVDEETVVDGNIVSGRRPPDLPSYAKAFIEVVKERS